MRLERVDGNSRRVRVLRCLLIAGMVYTLVPVEIEGTLVGRRACIWGSGDANVLFRDSVVLLTIPHFPYLQPMSKLNRRAKLSHFGSGSR